MPESTLPSTVDECWMEMDAIISGAQGRDLTGREVDRYLELESHLNRLRSDRIRDRHDAASLVVTPRTVPRYPSAPRGHRTAAYDVARRHVDALASSGLLTDRGASVVTALLDSPDQRQRDTAATWAAAAGNPDYLSAFAKLLRDPERGHMLWTENEAEAYREVERMRTAPAVRNALTRTGWVLPVSLDPAVILANAGSISPVRVLARTETTATDTWRGILTTGATAEWKGEAVEAADGTPSADEVEIGLFASSCYAQWSWELAAATDEEQLVNQLSTVMNDALVNQLNAAWINGNGTTQPQGLVTGIVVDGNSVITTIGSEAVDPTDPTRMQAVLPARYSAGAAWLSHIATRNAYAFVETANGSLLFPELRQNPPMLLGKPWFEASDMDGVIDPNVAGNNYVLLYGDLRRGYITVDGAGSVARVVTVAGPNGRPTGESGLIIWSRHGAKVVNPDAMRLLNVPTTA